MIDHFKEDQQAFHRYLFKGMKYKDAKDLVDAKPLRVREQTRLNINSIKGKDFV